ncbi:hypothetical protein SZ64_10850 [Erythrobacter sp. SG61-1L]|uniref:hypothetical protein n=1 Tax=Erythrobacter sp. SG61-1L TaxID=1603897 RepID=UPI0006C90CC0|nr:hypothetical protein [Erythrobacter sp. SG61-1L]KPL68559.1 hypothetical protein SZ64_10850 [Erythrobacter sp. SG61-1L]
MKASRLATLATILCAAMPAVAHARDWHEEYNELVARRDRYLTLLKQSEALMRESPNVETACAHLRDTIGYTRFAKVTVTEAKKLAEENGDWLTGDEATRDLAQFVSADERYTKMHRDVCGGEPSWE